MLLLMQEEIFCLSKAECMKGLTRELWFPWL